MTRTMYDAVDAREIPLTAQLAAGYANGTYQWLTNSWTRFPIASRVTIDINATRPASDVLDVENGDATVEQTPGWVTSHNHLTAFPAIIYCSRATLTPVFNALRAHGHTIAKDFQLWISTLDGTKTVPDMTGVLAVQYQNTPGYDLSVVYNDHWKAAPASTPPGQRTIIDYRAREGDTWDSVAAAHHLTAEALFDFNTSSASGRPLATQVLLKQRGINTLYQNELVRIP